MTDVWSQRRQAYVESDAHREGADLDRLVEWSSGARTALDVATGGGHVARRLRDAGIRVVTTDSAPGMQPDVICPAEDLPFADGSFDVVVCRTAAHHFADPGAALREMARVARRRVLVVDTVHMGDDVEEAERLRDPSHVRNYTEGEWRAMLLDAGLRLVTVEIADHVFDLAALLARTGCEGAEAARVVELLGDRATGGRLRLDKILVEAEKAG
jgi:ubiquinone/menaquinone biosynthesis C-methylase UbiE